VEPGTLSLRQWKMSGSWQDAGNQIQIGRFSLNFWREVAQTGSESEEDFVEILGFLVVICCTKVYIRDPEYTEDIVTHLFGHWWVLIVLEMQITTFLKFKLYSGKHHINHARPSMAHGIIPH
jgi:hypothetical protein